MEKLKPTYDLAAIKAAIGSVEKLSITVSAYRTALGLGYDDNGIADVINGIERRMFVKSMTMFADHRLWQVPGGCRHRVSGDVVQGEIDGG